MQGGVCSDCSFAMWLRCPSRFLFGHEEKSQSYLLSGFKSPRIVPGPGWCADGLSKCESRSAYRRRQTDTAEIKTPDGILIAASERH